MRDEFHAQGGMGVFTNIENGEHNRPLEIGDLNVWIGRFFRCHLAGADGQKHCDRVYGSSSDSLCSPTGSVRFHECVRHRPPRVFPQCTGEDVDPYATGQHVKCCDNLTEVVRAWEKDGRMYSKCQSPSAFELRAKAHSAMCLSFDTGEHWEHDWVHLWDCSAWNRNARLWRWGANGEIYNVHSGKCLDIDSTGGYKSGTKVQVWPCSGWAGQLWEKHGREIRNRHSGKCLDMDSKGQFATGTDVQIWHCSDWKGQQFEQQLVSSPSTKLSQLMPSPPIQSPPVPSPPSPVGYYGAKDIDADATAPMVFV